METWPGILLAATALHLGFQVTVSTLVYPALARVPPASWAQEHDRHSRRIVPLVVGVYAAVLVACVNTLLASASGGGRPLAAALAVAGNGVALVLTAVAAAPLHGRLGRGHDPFLVGRLLLVDRARTAAVALALVGAVLAQL